MKCNKIPRMINSIDWMLQSTYLQLKNPFKKSKLCVANVKMKMNQLHWIIWSSKNLNHLIINKIEFLIIKKIAPIMLALLLRWLNITFDPEISCWWNSINGNWLTKQPSSSYSVYFFFFFIFTVHYWASE